VYLRSILNDFGFEQVSPKLLYEDWRTVTGMAENPVNRKAYAGRCIDKGSTCSSIWEAQGRNAREKIQRMLGLCSVLYGIQAPNWIDSEYHNIAQICDMCWLY
jgi:hypothetical protein